MVEDGPPSASPDFFVIPLSEQTTLSVLDNDAAVFGNLTVSSASASTHGLVAPCANASCILYTPRYRFSGYDTVAYTATDARGRSVSSIATLRIRTSPPGFSAIPADLTSPQETAVSPFAGAAVTYDDQAWNLTLTVTFRAGEHAPAAARWRADTLSLLPRGSTVDPGSLQALALLARAQVEVVDGAAVRATLQGNLSEVSALLQDVTVRPPEGYAGVAQVALQVCSQWTECSVRSSPAPDLVWVHPCTCMPMFLGCAPALPCILYHDGTLTLACALPVFVPATGRQPAGSSLVAVLRLCNFRVFRAPTKNRVSRRVWFSHSLPNGQLCTCPDCAPSVWKQKCSEWLQVETVGLWIDPVPGSDYLPTLQAPALPTYSFLLPPAGNCSDDAVAMHRLSGFGTIDGVPAVPDGAQVTQADRDACAACMSGTTETVAMVMSVHLDFPPTAAQVCCGCCAPLPHDGWEISLPALPILLCLFVQIACSDLHGTCRGRTASFLYFQTTCTVLSDDC